MCALLLPPLPPHHPKSGEKINKTLGWVNMKLNSIIFNFRKKKNPYHSPQPFI